MSGYIQNIRKKIGHDRLIVAGAGVIVYKDRQVLLQRRRDNNSWGLHAGAIEIGESVEDTAKRELKEETGLSANKLELLCVYSGENTMYTYPNEDEVFVVGIYYVCNDFSGTVLEKSDEVLELKWFDINDLPEITALEKKAFEEFCKRFT